jgi:hypothetical protein
LVFLYISASSPFLLITISNAPLTFPFVSSWLTLWTSAASLGAPAKDKKMQAGNGGDTPGLLGGRDIKYFKGFEVIYYQKLTKNASKKKFICDIFL